MNLTIDASQLYYIMSLDGCIHKIITEDEYIEYLKEQEIDKLPDIKLISL